jgi:hypothetical protein
LNAYTVSFYANCPNNNIRIGYRLRIETYEVIGVEDLIATVEAVGKGYHEEIADDMHKRFGGVQTMTAEHHGVTIETTRTK